MLNTLVTFDVETTGLHPITERVIELAAVRWENGQPVAEFASLVNPGRAIDPRSIAIHGITDADVASAPKVGSVLEEFDKFSAGATLAAHNAGFDIGFLSMESARERLSFAPRSVIDTLPLSRAAFPTMPSHRLERLAKALHIHAGEAHRALADSLTAGRVLFEALTRLDGRVPAECLLEWAPTLPNSSRKPLRTLHEAARSGYSVEIRYTDRDGHEADFEIVPVALLEIMRNRYVHAFCPKFRADRTFRIDRISRARALPSSLLPF